VDDLEAWKKLAREHRGVTQELAAFIAGLRSGDIPQKTREILGHALVDALGCGLYGLTTPWGRIMAEFAREQQGPAEAALWGGGTRVSAVNTVLAGFATPGIAINPSLYAKVPYKLSDFKAISLVGEAPLVLLARPSLGVKSIDDLVKMSRKAPDAIRFGSSGNGSSSHLAAEVLRAMTDLQYLHVPYKGGGAAMADVVGGQTDITVLPISESLPFIREKRLQAMGQTGRVRSPIAPDIPTIEEGGVKGYASTTWYMLAAPAKVPQNVVDTLAGRFAEALRQPDLREKLQNVGVTTINGGPDQAGEFMASEAVRWEKLITAAKIRLE